ncbi:MAG TPA: PEP-CTERM sorting domain-containing protein [Bryobacteraceae bacterium]|nr:PEP-CTERM sorting domain-containing protein [Bryobacteraceae bacterium]
MKIATSIAVLALASSTAVLAVPVVSLHASNVGISALGFSVVGNTINISETWTSNAVGVLELSGLDLDVSYTVVKTITNNTGTNWTRIANELLDPLDGNDGSDVLPYPGFVPAGYSTSNNNDGLSFDQGGSIARTSSAFANVQADEVTDVRDFLDFFNGAVPNGGVFTVQFGVLDQSFAGGNQPLLLVQRPNARSVPPDVPEPGTMGLLGSGLLACAAYLGRTRR